MRTLYEIIRLQYLCYTRVPVLLLLSQTVLLLGQFVSGVFPLLLSSPREIHPVGCLVSKDNALKSLSLEKDTFNLVLNSDCGMHHLVAAPLQSKDSV